MKGRVVMSREAADFDSFSLARSLSATAALTRPETAQGCAERRTSCPVQMVWQVHVINGRCAKGYRSCAYALISAYPEPTGPTRCSELQPAGDASRGLKW